MQKSGRFVRRARDQQVIAGADERQDRIGHRRGAAGVQHAAGAALQFYHRILQGEVGQRAASAVKQLAVGALRGGMLLAATESKTKEEARCVTGLTEPRCSVCRGRRRSAWFRCVLTSWYWLTSGCSARARLR